MEVACSQSNCTQLLVEYDKGLQRLPELERRQQICVACRFLHEVQYHTMGSIAAVVAATAEEQVSPITHYACTILLQQYSRVQQKSLSTNNPRSHHVCAVTVQQYSRKTSENAETSEIQLTLCPESSALPLSQHKKCSDYLPPPGG